MAQTRAQRRQARTAAIIDMSMAIIAAEGLDALTIPYLCKRLNISVGGLYRYFPSKEAIFFALQIRAIDAYRADSTAALHEAERAAEVADRADDASHLFRIGAAFSFYLRDAAADPVRHRLMDAFVSAPAAVLSDDDARAVNAHLGALLSDNAALLDAAAAHGALSPGDALARTHVLWSTLHGLDHFRKRDRILPPALRVSALMREALCAQLRGWGAKPAPLCWALDQTCALGPV